MENENADKNMELEKSEARTPIVQSIKKRRDKKLTEFCANENNRYTGCIMPQFRNPLKVNDNSLVIYPEKSCSSQKKSEGPTFLAAFS